ncbi:nuclear transport factor 2 family protein [Dyella acidiphila]|uniref:Nuclear transport factor 2 family protein n=1 Tax=Dyella acidiphila TaxID=2775866 RepID=A0ABR9G9S7_9GAMM|nr:nuclear transport factor 2 family protein [Dyella acidiphila]MBE1160790.1 nuclear transport factor 2 family protein [Dyella acidiphila]
MKKRIWIGMLLLALGGHAMAQDQPKFVTAAAPQDLTAIRHVMDSFHHAVVAHDGKGVAALFLDPGSTWVMALSDQAFAAARAKNASAQKVHVGSYKDFATFVSNTKSALDPRHTDIRIASDGTVASVYFHFDFNVDGKVNNRGDETWQLVKTADGWRIVAITYSVNPGAA